MKQIILKKIYKIDLEIFLFWIKLETKTQKYIINTVVGFILLLLFLIAAVVDHLTLEKIKF